MEQKRNKKKTASIVLAALIVLSVLAGVMPAVAKESAKINYDSYIHFEEDFGDLDHPGGVGIVDTFNFAYEPDRIYRDGDYLYYTERTNFNVRKYNLLTGEDTNVYQYGGNALMWIDGDYGFTGEELWDSMRRVDKFNKNTGETIWSVSNDDWSFGCGVTQEAIYVANGWSGVKKIKKSDGSVPWSGTSITRYCDDVVADTFRNTVFGVGWHSPTEIARIDPSNGAKIWDRIGHPECTQIKDITESAVWLRSGSTDRLEKWDITNGDTIETFEDEPYNAIWHLGPEGSLIDCYLDEANHALVWNVDNEGLSKIDTLTWEPLWEMDSTSSGYPLMTSDWRPFIDGPYLYFKDTDTPTKIYKFLWKGDIGPSVSISTDSFYYSPGDPMVITIDIANPTEHYVTFDWYWIVPQFDVFIPVMSVHIIAGYDDTHDLGCTIPYLGSTPFLNVFYVLLSDASGEIVDADVACWVYSPSGEATPAVDIGEEIKKTIEKIDN